MGFYRRIAANLKKRGIYVKSSEVGQIVDVVMFNGPLGAGAITIDEAATVVELYIRFHQVKQDP
jgi:hypothetical protein